MSVTGLVSILLAAILTNNFVLSKFLGICPFLGDIQKAGYSRRYECCRYLRYGSGNCCYMADSDIPSGS